MSEAEYAVAHRAALGALSAINRPKLRDIVAEAVAAIVVGSRCGQDVEADRRRWASLTADTYQKRRCLGALMRDLPDSAVVSTGPVDAAITAAATALLTQEEEAS